MQYGLDIEFMREFNTSGPNYPDRHYTVRREGLIHKGIRLVEKESYFTIWAPRQTGKSTYFRLLAKDLAVIGYKVAHINFENYQVEPLSAFLHKFVSELEKFWGIRLKGKTLGEVFYSIEQVSDQKFVLVIDEVEGINSAYFGSFLHAIRSVYHTRGDHALKSVVLVGVSNITGIVQDHASPFNITDNLDIPFFTDEETYELLGQHEAETGQVFAPAVKDKIIEITANQPGLVNGFARKLVEDCGGEDLITYAAYLRVEDWYLNISIDKNVANIVKIASRHRTFVEQLLFREERIRFQIDRPAIKVLHTNGLIRWDDRGYVAFWVPLYQKKLFYSFYPYTNGEGEKISQTMIATAYLLPSGRIDFDKLIDKYKNHIQLRSFRPFREKDSNGRFSSIKEAAMIYSFETFISIFLQEIEGHSYREAYVSLGNTDLIINVKGIEYLIETKKYYSPRSFQGGKGQLAYYCKRKGIDEGIYIVFIESHLKLEGIEEGVEDIEGVSIRTYLIRYDEVRDFGRKD